jgi:hypothetical protein
MMSGKQKREETFVQKWRVVPSDGKQLQRVEQLGQQRLPLVML